VLGKNTVLAIIPARGGSKGLPRKNIALLNGLPLISYPINAAKKSKYIDRVIVSTEDLEIFKIALDCGAEAPFLRPSELATDDAKTSDVINHVIFELKRQGDYYNIIVLLEPTSPFTEYRDVDSALSLLESNFSGIDSIVGISQVKEVHPDYLVRLNTNGLIRPYASTGFSETLRRQDLEPLYFFDGSLYISKTDVYIKKNSFYHDRTFGYEMPRWKSYEIDDYYDFLIAETIAKNIYKFTKLDS
jgi:N-acylneuraminate cytidylyltransferase/CMP-N,N'-diacetyllegionaminic acid synthase